MGDTKVTMQDKDVRFRTKDPQSLATALAGAENDDFHGPPAEKREGSRF